MPLFFILTGCALAYSKSQSINWKRLFKGIFIPYFTFSLIMFIYWVLLESRFRPIHERGLFPYFSDLISFKGQQFINIFIAMDYKDAFVYDIVLWYLPCLLMCRIIYGFIYKIKYPIVFVVILACMGVVLSEMVKIVFPMCLELAFVSVPFIFLGHKYYILYKENISRKFELVCILLGGEFLFYIEKKSIYLLICLNMNLLVVGFI